MNTQTPIAGTAGVAVPLGNADAASWRRQPSTYVRLLNGAFVAFSSTRLVSYLPNIWAIHTSADSSQHSLWTWGAFLGSNAVMSAWLYENNGRRVNKAIAVTAGNAVMCLVTCALIVWYRWAV